MVGKGYALSLMGPVKLALFDRDLDVEERRILLATEDIRFSRAPTRPLSLDRKFEGI